MARLAMRWHASRATRPRTAAARQAARFRRERQQPMLLFTELPLQQMLREIRDAHFPEIERLPPVYFIGQTSLAQITDSPAPTIYLHAILNAPEVPNFVFSFILKHELLHLRIPPRQLDGRWTSHPPEFFDQQRQLAPEASAAWDWIWRNLGPYLHERPQLERLDVRRKPLNVRRPAEWVLQPSKFGIFRPPVPASSVSPPGPTAAAAEPSEAASRPPWRSC